MFLYCAQSMIMVLSFVKFLIYGVLFINLLINKSDFISCKSVSIWFTRLLFFLLSLLS